MANTFKFRLDPLLRIRKHAEEDRKGALAQVQGKLNEQTARARRYDAMISQEHHALRDGLLVGTLDPRRLAHHRRYVNSMMRGLVQTLCERAGTQKEADKARAKLIEAVKQRKVLEKLRERRQADWRSQQDRVERSVLDEMGLASSRRARQEDRT
jgi:flagellar FliJ protein